MEKDRLPHALFWLLSAPESTWRTVSQVTLPLTFFRLSLRRFATCARLGGVFLSAVNIVVFWPVMLCPTLLGQVRR